MKDYFKKYLENRCSDDEFESVINDFTDASCAGELNDQLTENWSEIPGDIEAPDLSDTLFKIHYRINQGEISSRKSRRLLTLLTRVAAVLLLPAAITFFYLGQQSSGSEDFTQTISTPMASKTSFVLPDGSKVWLNSGSTISYDGNFDGELRKVKLVGEAYFDVQKSKRPFVVETGLFSVNVLGTAFNVMAYEHEIPTVTLERGKIMLETQSKTKEFLSPGQQAVIDTSSQKINLKTVETDLYSSWINNRLIFRDEPLRNVIPRLERWYNIEIDVTDKSLNNIPMTAQIEFESIREVMELMSLTMPLTYRYSKDKRQLVILKK
jgi:ferric-dicitrate binding protein FerR (iron transport regulator)